MNCKLYHLLIHAVDKEGSFYQNLYSYGNNFEDAVNKTINFLYEEGYSQIEIEEYELIDIDGLPAEDLIQDESYDGFIQNIKFSYDKD